MAAPRPVIARFLENPSGEFLYAVVEQMRDDDVHGELTRFRVHYHPAGTPRTATTSNTIVLDETGNQHDLRLSFVKFLLDKRDAGWKRTGASTFGSSQLSNSGLWKIYRKLQPRKSKDTHKPVTDAPTYVMEICELCQKPVGYAPHVTDADGKNPLHIACVEAADLKERGFIPASRILRKQHE